MARSRRHLAANAWGSVLRVHARLVPLMDTQLRARHGLSLACYDILLELQAVPEGRLTMSELGDRAVLSRTRVSRVVDELARNGLVSRETNPSDKRSAFATITPTGRAAFRAAAPTYLRLIEKHVALDLSDDELVQLADLLERIASTSDTHTSR
jgi:DNA-binding MarR family transcriptional regulator